MPQKKKYFAVIVKIHNKRFLRLRKVENFVKLCAWLDENCEGWRWANVYYYREPIGGFSTKLRPQWRHHTPIPKYNPNKHLPETIHQKKAQGQSTKS